MVNGVSVTQRKGLGLGKIHLPSLILGDGELTTRRFVEFFTAKIRNKGTRATYANAVFDFCDWCTAPKTDPIHPKCSCPLLNR